MKLVIVDLKKYKHCISAYEHFHTSGISLMGEENAIERENLTKRTERGGELERNIKPFCCSLLRLPLSSITFLGH